MVNSEGMIAEFMHNIGSDEARVGLAEQLQLNPTW
jgi:hypothetical protein